MSPQRELIPFLLQTHCPHKFYVTFWTISICAGIWLSWQFYFSPTRLSVPPYFVHNSCDISVDAELNGDSWLVIYLSSLSLVVRLSFLFLFSTQSFIICPPQSAEFYLAAFESPAPLQTGLRLFVNVFVVTLDTERRARTVLPNIWSICCFTGPTPPLKMPQGTAPFTFLPCTIRYVNNPLIIVEIKERSSSHSSLRWHQPTRLSLPEWSGELCACPPVQGSK